MLNHEGSHPEYFEELCALAAGGQISEQEFIELQEHLQHCTQCPGVYADFTDLVHKRLPLLNPQVMARSGLLNAFSADSSYRDRFLARARKEGISVARGPSRDSVASKFRIWLWLGGRYAQLATVAVAGLLATAGVLGYNSYQTNARYMRLERDKVALNTESRKPGTGESGGSRERAAPNTSPLDKPLTSDSHNRDTQGEPVPSPSGAKAELAAAFRDRATAEGRLKTLERQLEMVASELQALRADNQEAGASREQLEKKLKAAEQATTLMNDELEQTRRTHANDRVTIAAQDLEMQKLSEKLTEQSEILERERTLLAAGRDIHDLMGARNLHIVDVLEVDSKGRDQRAFGRIFYTEQKSLIFYGFDLGDRNTEKRNASFQVWGTQGPAQKTAQNLGIFYVDDQKSNRWVLKFEDRRILSEIDSVFVTIEPPGGSAKPTGRKFLYAYLNANPNHP